MSKNMLEEALLPLAEWINGLEPEQKISTNVKMMPHYEPKNMEIKGARLRVDYEVSMDALDEGVNVGDLVTLLLVNDLWDLTENGDVNKTTDWLLSAMNGSKVRGKQPVAINIPEATFYAEHRSRKESVEYTLWIRYNVDWE